MKNILMWRFITSLKYFLENQLKVAELLSETIFIHFFYIL